MNTFCNNTLNLTIHRGSHEIGGSCIELSTTKSTIVLDYGMPLEKQNKKDLKLKNIDAVLISHAHQDHYGLIDTLDMGIKIYASAYTHNIIKTTQIFTSNNVSKINFIEFKKNTIFHVGDFKITPYLTDHSASDSYAFLIEVNDKRIFYSGDFRANGRKAYLFNDFITNPPKDIDILLMEGTMLKRANHKYQDENSVEEAMSKILNNDNFTMFIFSSQNIDRIVSAYKSCKVNKKILVIDIYTAWVLKLAQGLSKKIPNISWSDIKVLSKDDYAKPHRKKLYLHQEYFDEFYKSVYSAENCVAFETIKSNPKKYAMKVSPYIMLDIVKRLATKTNVIYSQWSGYQEKTHNPNSYKVFQDLINEPLVSYEEIHTSGHATLSDLKKFSKALKPKKLIPIHTQEPELYKKHFDNVFLLEDGKKISIGDNNERNHI